MEEIQTTHTLTRERAWTNGRQRRTDQLSFGTMCTRIMQLTEAWMRFRGWKRYRQAMLVRRRNYCDCLIGSPSGVLPGATVTVWQRCQRPPSCNRSSFSLFCINSINYSLSLLLQPPALFNTTNWTYTYARTLMNDAARQRGTLSPLRGSIRNFRRMRGGFPHYFQSRNPALLACLLAARLENRQQG